MNATTALAMIAVGCMLLSIVVAYLCAKVNRLERQLAQVGRYRVLSEARP